MTNSGAREAFLRYRQQEEEDAVVCQFGPDYFRGARAGAGCGAVVTAGCSAYSYRFMRRDQRAADAAVGFGPSARNTDFPKGVLRRGFVTQPMLAMGCFCLAVTSVLKVMKCRLAHRRCLEFEVDDVGFDLLMEMTAESPDAAAVLDGLRETVLQSQAVERQQTSLLEDFRSTQESGKSWKLSNALADQVARRSPSIARHPTFADGVAVGLAGSIMDCYTPQKPPSSYYNMHFGWGL